MSRGSRSRRKSGGKAAFIISAVFLVVIAGIIACVFLFFGDDSGETKPAMKDVSGSSSSAKDVMPGVVTDAEADEITDSTIKVKWSAVENAQGYNIYVKSEDDKSFSKKGTVKSSDKPSYKIESLSQSEGYSFYVTAYNGSKETTQYYVVGIIYTAPKKPVITNITCPEEGTAHIEWEANEKAKGYKVEYRLTGSEKFLSDKAVDIKDHHKNSTDITELEDKSTYDFRVTSYVESGGKRTDAVGEVKSFKLVESVAAPEESGTVDPDKPMVALTFDDGPLGEPSDRILDILEKNDAKATFFMVGNCAATYPDNVIRKAKLGMELGNHTWDHKSYGSSVTAEDISKASDEIFDITGVRPSCFRSPGGITTDEIKTECINEGMPLYFWSVDTEDWKYRDANHIYKSVMDTVKDGDIILMHEIYGTTADALEKIVPELKEKGYQLVTCKELIQAKTGEPPEPGKQYRRGSSTD